MNVIPIGRAVGFEHYGEVALPREEWENRKKGFRHYGEIARPLTDEERKNIAPIKQS